MSTRNESAPPERSDSADTPHQQDRWVLMTPSLIRRLEFQLGAQASPRDPANPNDLSLTLLPDRPNPGKVWQAATFYLRTLDKAEAEGPASVSPEELSRFFQEFREAVEACDQVWLDIVRDERDGI